MIEQFIAEVLFDICRFGSQAGKTVDHITNQMEAVEIIPYHHIERCGGTSFFFVSPDMQVLMIGPPVGKPVDQLWIAVKGENDWFIGGENGIKILITQSVRMFTLGLKWSSGRPHSPSGFSGRENFPRGFQRQRGFQGWEHRPSKP